MKSSPLSIFSLVTLVACSSTPKTIQSYSNENILNHMSQEKKYLGNSFDTRFEKDGILNGEYVAIASIKGSVTDNEKQMITMAAADAKATLLENAPQNFKKVVQSAISTTMDGNGTVDSSAVSVNEIHALTGVMVKFEDTQCARYAVPNENMGYDFIKECRAIARVPAINLARAFKYTLNKKYADLEVSNSLKDNLLKELKNDE
jgi:hypothetical protein